MHAKKPLSKAYPEVLKTIGDHIRKRRVELKLFQKDVSKILGVKKESIYNWENNYASPKIHLLSKIIKFLGYIPFQLKLETVGGKIIAYRILNGLNQKKLAKQLGIDPTTLARWEKNKGKPHKDFLNEIVKSFKMYEIPIN
ncbi:MAG: helix-turn-helix domain-containing protein [Ignavibacteriaceae bacterium]